MAAQSDSEKSKAKLNIQWHHYHPTLVSLHTSFSGTVVNLEANDVHNILQYGAARRISSIYHWAKIVCRIAYPDRVEVLTQDESRELSDALMLIYVHMVGVLDALAIAFKRLQGDSLKDAEKKADILSKKFRMSIGLATLESFFNENNEWFFRIKDELRNRYVHRVPPYIAPAILTNEDSIEHERLQIIFNEALKNLDFTKMQEMRDLQAKIGKFFPFISFIDANEHLPLLPTILNDLFRFQVVTLTILEELVPRLSFRK